MEATAHLLPQGHSYIHSAIVPFSASGTSPIILRRAASLFLLVILVGDSWAQDHLWEVLGLNDTKILTAEILSDGTLLAGADTRIFQWSDQGDWSSTSLGNTHPYLYAISTSPDGTIYTGDGYRLYKRPPGATAWEGMYETITHGRTWLTSLSAAGDLNITAVIIGFYKFKDFYGMMYVSDDGGETWTDQFFSTSIYRASVGNDGEIIAGTWTEEARDEAWANNSILRSVDRGGSWSVVKELGSIMVRDFVRTESGDLYAGAAASYYAWIGNFRHDESRPGEGGLYSSRDKGLTWTTLRIMEDDRAIVSLATCCGGEVYALSAGGTIYSVQDDDNVSSVAHFDTTGVHPIELLVDEERRFYIATTLNGVYRSVHPLGTDIEDDLELPKGPGLIGNYPNPFDQRTTIRYELPRAMHVKLSVFDLLGREREVLVDGFTQAGSHSAVLEASSLPNGVYLYLLDVEGHAQTGTMMLLNSQ